jgi:glycosyltransferase involved in cell wall biosynthesis
VAGETQQQIAQLEAVVHDQGRELLARVETQQAQLLEALRFIHSHGAWRRERLRELRAHPSYEQPYIDPDPLVSVVIATYKNHQLLRERAIPSVLAQTYQNFEVVVVGDAAPDDARVAVESFGDARLSFINLPYRGPYPDDPRVAWMVSGVPPTNEAIHRARGLWIAPLADDDAFRPQHIERLLDRARRDRLELAYGRLAVHFADGQEMTIGCFPPELGQFGVQAAIYHAGLADIFEYELADAALGLPEDWGFCLRTMEAGVRIGMLDEVTVDYYPSRNWTQRWEGDRVGPWLEGQRGNDAESPLKLLDARARDQDRALARIEEQLDVGASPSRSEEKAPAPAHRSGVRTGTNVTPRADSLNPPPLLTVIMTTYNQERYVADAIDSVLAQRTGFQIHLIITDDASTDSTPDIVETYRVRRPELITFIRSDVNGGYFANMLRALALTDTEYFTLLDGDDYWTDETYLQRGVDFLESHREFVIYSANVVCAHLDGSRSLIISEDAPDDEFSFEDYLQNSVVPTPTNSTIFRNVLFKNGIPTVFAEMLGTDEEYSFLDDWTRYAIHLEKGKAHFENRVVGVYRITGDGMWTGLNEFEQDLWEARRKLDHWRYFGYRHPEFFLTWALNRSERCLEVMRDVVSGTSTEIVIKPEQVASLRRVVEECRSHLASLVESPDARGEPRHREAQALDRGMDPG